MARKTLVDAVCEYDVLSCLSNVQTTLSLTKQVLHPFSMILLKIPKLSRCQQALRDGSAVL